MGTITENNNTKTLIAFAIGTCVWLNVILNLNQHDMPITFFLAWPLSIVDIFLARQKNKNFIFWFGKIVNYLYFAAPIILFIVVMVLGLSV